MTQIVQEEKLEKRKYQLYFVATNSVEGSENIEIINMGKRRYNGKIDKYEAFLQKSKH